MFWRVESSPSPRPKRFEVSPIARSSRRRELPGRHLHAQHERADLRLVVVEAPPLEADDVLLGHALVAGGDQRGQLVADPERRLLLLEPLDGVALEDELPVDGRSFLGRSHRATDLPRSGGTAMPHGCHPGTQARTTCGGVCQPAALTRADGGPRSRSYGGQAPEWLETRSERATKLGTRGHLASPVRSTHPSGRSPSGCGTTPQGQVAEASQGRIPQPLSMRSGTMPATVSHYSRTAARASRCRHASRAARHGRRTDLVGTAYTRNATVGGRLFPPARTRRRTVGLAAAPPPRRRRTAVPIDVRTPAPAGAGEVLTADALALVEDLERTFGARRRELLPPARSAASGWTAGEPLGFLAETAAIRARRLAGRAGAGRPDDRRVEITGPAERKMTINALNSRRARVHGRPRGLALAHLGQRRRRARRAADAVRRRTLDFDEPGGQASTGSATDLATLLVRPRGWHLPRAPRAASTARRSRRACSTSGSTSSTTARELLERGTRPVLYLPKLESHLEARLWNDVFRHAQDAARPPAGHDPRDRR